MVETVQVSKAAQKKGRKAVESQGHALEVLKVEYIPIVSIKPNTYNPNRQSKHEFQLLLKSMKDHGFTQPIIVQKESREIVDGEHRWRAAMELGYKEIPVVYVTMSIAQMRIATLSHNRARGQENVELTAELLRDLEKIGALEWAQESLEMDDIEIQRLIDDVSAPDGLAGEEFSQPWQPVKGSTDADAVSMTLEAAKRIRKVEQKIKEAKSQEEREQIRKDHDVFRLNLIFADKEADLVKDVLGKQPAKTIVDLCNLYKKDTRLKLSSD